MSLYGTRIRSRILNLDKSVYPISFVNKSLRLYFTSPGVPLYILYALHPLLSSFSLSFIFFQFCSGIHRPVFVRLSFPPSPPCIIAVGRRKQTKKGTANHNSRTPTLDPPRSLISYQWRMHGPWTHHILLSCTNGHPTLHAYIHIHSHSHIQHHLYPPTFRVPVLFSLIMKLKDTIAHNHSSPHQLSIKPDMRNMTCTKT